jgi:hypothetical protein
VLRGHYEEVEGRSDNTRREPISAWVLIGVGPRLCGFPGIYNSLTAAVAAALVARQPAAFAGALILQGFSPPSVTASRHPQKLTSSQ